VKFCQNGENENEREFSSAIFPFVSEKIIIFQKKMFLEFFSRTIRL
jgi:hypothetical protein